MMRRQKSVRLTPWVEVIAAWGEVVKEWIWLDHIWNNNGLSMMRTCIVRAIKRWKLNLELLHCRCCVCLYLNKARKRRWSGDYIYTYQLTSILYCSVLNNLIFNTYIHTTLHTYYAHAHAYTHTHTHTWYTHAHTHTHGTHTHMVHTRTHTHIHTIHISLHKGVLSLAHES